MVADTWILCEIASSIDVVLIDVTHLTRHYKGYRLVLVCNLESVDILPEASGLVTRTVADRYQPKCWK